MVKGFRVSFYLFLIFLHVHLFIFEREREREGESGEGQRVGEYQAGSTLPAPQPDVELDLTNLKIMT